MFTPENVKEYRAKKNLFSFIVSFGVSTLIIYLFSLVLFDISTVSGKSMYPTIDNKDITIAGNSRFFKASRGDIVNIDSDYLGEGIIKRIIALGGDTVEINNGNVYVNGEHLEEDYITEKTQGNTVLTIPQDEVFVMGDNRGESLDSREIGCINLSEISSVVLMTFSHADTEE